MTGNDWSTLVAAFGRNVAPWVLVLGPLVGLVVWLVRWIIKRTAAELSSVRRDCAERLRERADHEQAWRELVRGYQENDREHTRQINALMEGQRTLQGIMEGLARVLREGERS